MNEFDLITCPLSGPHGISAGAGTGKTYAISHLYLRLLLEKALPVETILVVTFTEAATAELRNRIRELIIAALDIVESHQGDENLVAIVHNHQHHYGSEKTRNLLITALYSFDQAAICTIHSFCLRVLRDHAFETSMAFNTELISNQQVILQSAIDDFWRHHMYSSSPFLINYAMNHGFDPKRLYNLIKHHLGRPDLVINPQQPFVDIKKNESQFLYALQEVRDAWFTVHTEVINLLLQAPGLNRNKYRPTSIHHLRQLMNSFLCHGDYNAELFPGFEKFTNQEILLATKKKQYPPEHFFFSLCDTLYEHGSNLCTLLEKQILALKGEIFHYLSQNLARVKQQRNIYTFDDLLTNLYQALQESDKDRLTAFLKKKFRAVLVDEFQDTDPIQYTIFNSSFVDQDFPLFFIGDPKQAIYSFRGADIFTFMDAVNALPDHQLYTLRTNYRSGPSLVQALNIFFRSSNNPFIYAGIPFFDARIRQGSANSSVQVTINQQPMSPFNIWYFSSTDLGSKGKDKQTFKPISKEIASHIIGKAVANQVVNLMRHGFLVNEQLCSQHSITPKDIAVLVRTQQQAQLIKDVFSDLRIPAVLYNTGNIFDTQEATELNHFLHAVAYPYKYGYIHCALCTPLFGLDAHTLFQALEEGTSIEKYYDEFTDYHNLWAEYGFTHMFSTFLTRQQVRKKILSLPEGERRLTNILHLQEILQEQSRTNHLNFIQLCTWFATQLNPNTPRLEEYEQRLEKDDNAVKILTIHRAKGLEFPIAFCPFTWGGSHMRGKEFIYHNKENKRIYEIGGNTCEASRQTAEKELLAENIRLLYVAVTRAKYQCYLIWGRFSQADSSAPAYLFHYPDSDISDFTVDKLAKQVKELDDQQRYQAIEQLVDRSEGSISGKKITPFPEESLPISETAPEEIQALEFHHTLPRSQNLMSFSSLTHKKSGFSIDIAEKHIDETLSIPPVSQSISPPDHPKSDCTHIVDFPRGATAGTCLHEILEDLDFTTRELDLIHTLVSEKLVKYGFPEGWASVICRTTIDLLNAPLLKGEDNLTLSQITNKQTMRELEFYYPIKEISTPTLTDIFKSLHSSTDLRELPKQIGSLDIQPIQGYMHGFIDLVFVHNNRYYIVDWKSTYLGDSPESYTHDAMQENMVDSLYYLQAHIYTLAIDKYLSSRIANYTYETHFGGVFYIYLRGISTEKNASKGIFFDKPDIQLIEQWRQIV